MKKTKKPLGLKREYIRLLTLRDLAQPQGGRDIWPSDEDSCKGTSE